MKKIKILTIIAGLLLTGCSAVKRLNKPDLQLPQQIVENVEADSLTVADMGWWEFYGDEYLKAIIQRTLEHNKQLQMAMARVEQARDLYNVDKAKLFPELSAGLPWNYETNDYFQENRLRDPELGVKATVSWEADLFGSLRWGKKKSQQQYMATMEDLRAMRMVLVAEVASAYFRLVAYDNELSIVRNTMDTRRESVRLAKLRFEGGLTSETVYQQAVVQYATAAALIPRLEYNIEITENVLSLLMGAYPDEKIERAQSLKDNTLPERVPIGLPSQLLERRPDLRSQEFKLQAAAANVGVTYANRFPRLTLGVTGGWENDHFRGLFDSPFSYIVGNLAAPIFDFGKRKNTYKAAVAAYEESRLLYEHKVIAAFNEVNDALSRYDNTRKAVTLNHELMDAASQYQNLTWKQFRAGTINYIDELDAERRLLEAQIALSNAMRDEHLALIELYKALGGGWQLQPAAE